MTADATSGVLDSSALLAYFGDEPGSETGDARLLAGPITNAMHLAEVLSKLREAGEEPGQAHHLRRRGSFVAWCQYRQ